MKWSTTLIGFTYGLALALLAALAAGFGHGLYAPLALVSSPFALVGVRSALAATPLLWASIGFLLNPSRRRLSAFVVIAVLALSYGGAAVLLHVPNDGFADYDRWSQLTDSIRMLSTITICLWLAGQVAIWARIGFVIHRDR